MTKEEEKALKLKEAIERTNKKFSNKKNTLKKRKKSVLINYNKIDISPFLDVENVCNVHFKGEFKQYHSVVKMSGFVIRDLNEKVKDLKTKGFNICQDNLREVKYKCRETLFNLQNDIYKKCNTCGVKKKLSSFGLVQSTCYTDFNHKCKECATKYNRMRIVEHRIMQNRSNKPKSKTYLMKDNLTKLYKIGKSINPKFRESTLQSEKPSIKMVKVWDSDIEKELHIKYHRLRVRGEWFALNKIQVRYICTHF